MSDPTAAKKLAAEIVSLIRDRAYTREYQTSEVAKLILAAEQAARQEAEAARDKLQAFKDWVHAYLDGIGVPHHPPGTHGAEGCRIGDRMDWLIAEKRAAEAEVARLRELNEGLAERVAKQSELLSKRAEHA